MMLLEIRFHLNFGYLQNKTSKGHWKQRKMGSSLFRRSAASIKEYLTSFLLNTPHHSCAPTKQTWSYQFDEYVSKDCQTDVKSRPFRSSTTKKNNLDFTCMLPEILSRSDRISCKFFVPKMFLKGWKKKNWQFVQMIFRYFSK